MASSGCVRDTRAPRSANHSPLEGESQKPSRQAKADAVGGIGAPPEIENFFTINIDAQDAQDAQDEQDESFLHQKPARAMIRCGLADAQDYRTPDS